MTVPERIMTQLARVKNLMENAGTDGEMAAAAAAMARLLQKYNIDAADIPDVDAADRLDDTIYGDESIGIQDKMSDWKWKVDLVHKIAIYNFCTSIITEREDKTKPRMLTPREKRFNEKYPGTYSGHYPRVKVMTIVGKRHNTEVVRFLYTIITRRLEELAKGYPVGSPIDTSDWEQGDPMNTLAFHLYHVHSVASFRQEEFAKKHPGGREQLHNHMHSGAREKRIGPRKSFLYGAVETINERLRKQFEDFKRGQSGDASKALVVINTNTKAISAFVASRYGKLSSYDGAHNRSEVDRAAYEAGRAAGKSMQFQQGVGGGKGGVGTLGIGSGKRSAR